MPDHPDMPDHMGDTSDPPAPASAEGVPMSSYQELKTQYRREAARSFRKRTQWKVECLLHGGMESLLGLIPLPWIFRLGEGLGSTLWHAMPKRRGIAMRNLRIAYAGEKDLAQIETLARLSFRRTVANLLAGALASGLSREKLRKAVAVENMELLQEVAAEGKGAVIIMAHMGSWEMLSRIGILFPSGISAGALYRPLNNPLMDAKVLERREADGMRMFSKGDSLFQIAGFVREGGVVGILADQRVGIQGVVTSFFGRLTRSTPLPTLLARKARCPVLALSMTTVGPGRWKATFLRVSGPHTHDSCTLTLQNLMRSGPEDVFWFQDRWKTYLTPEMTISKWLADPAVRGPKPHRGLLWLAGGSDLPVPETWTHGDLTYEVVLEENQARPAWLSPETTVHRVSPTHDISQLRGFLRRLDLSQDLPIDIILVPSSHPALRKAGRKEGLNVVELG